MSKSCACVGKIQLFHVAKVLMKFRSIAVPIHAEGQAHNTEPAWLDSTTLFQQKK